MAKSKSGLDRLSDKVLYSKYGKWLWVMRTMPDHATHWLGGLFLPPHERLWLRNFFADYKENNIVASRGTSKSFSHASLAAPLKALLYRNLGVLTVSASGFRGGQELFKDVERMFRGQLKSQRLSGDYLYSSCNNPKIIRRNPSIWTVALKSNSEYSTIPTNNADAMRGLRANIAIIDERNTFDGTVVRKTIRPMLNVGQDFRRTAVGGEMNQTFQISTIDFTVRDWYPEIEESKRMVRKQYEAMQALKHGNIQEYKNLMAEKDGSLRNASFSYSQVDYTDLIIPEHISSPDGTRMRVNFPLPKGLKKKQIFTYDPYDDQSYYFLYPVDKKSLEQPLRAGYMDEELWMAEQRNRFITSAGNVFDYMLIHKASEKPVYESGEIPFNRGIKEEWYLPVLYTCGDPCVLGVDVARESDETAFVVIRLGELSEGRFDPTLTTYDDDGRVVLGKTEWNGVIWAETHKNMPADEAASKIRDLFSRYNIISTPELGGIGMDKRGGGGAVRDDLGNPKPDMLDDNTVDPNWSFESVLKIYDPGDGAGFGHYTAYDGPKFWGGLRLLATTNNDNVEWTYGTRALMQQNKLYIAFWQPPSRWAFERGLVDSMGQPDRQSEEFMRLMVGYDGIRKLKQQLLLLQVKRTETGVIRFVMPSGDTEGKKDLYSGLIYGVHMAREHLRYTTMSDNEAPMVAPVLVEIGSMNRQVGRRDYVRSNIGNVF